MFEAVRNNRKYVQIVLVLIILPFALWGIMSDLRRDVGDEDSLGKIGGEKLTLTAFEARVRQAAAERQDQTGVDTPEFRQAVLETWLNEKAIEVATKQAGLFVPQSLIEDAYLHVPEFQENGKFSPKLAEKVLTEHGMTGAQYDERVRESALRSLMMAPMAQGTAIAKTTLVRWVAMSEEQRTVAEWKIDGAALKGKVTLAPDAVEKYYDTNKAQFESPERVKVEYVVLNADELAKKVLVSDAEAHKWYDEHQKDFMQTEERRMSHILVGLPADAKSDQKEAARKKAEALLAQVKANPASFARIAKENSTDQGSADKGGDLGFNQKGAMVPEFDEAAFSLKPHEISGIVATQFGFHIIQLNDVRPGKVRPFDEVKGQIVDKLQALAGSKRLAESTDEFSNLVFNQPDTFKDVAGKLGLVIQKSDWIQKGVPTGGPLDNPKLRTAIFAADAIAKRQNSEALDIGQGSVASVRVVDYQAKHLRPLDEVRQQISTQLMAAETEKVAKAEGEARLEKLRAGSAVGASWGPAKSVRRHEMPSAEVRKMVFGANTAKLPVYVGSVTPDGYSIYRIDQVTKATISPDDARVETLAKQFNQLYGTADLKSMLTGMRTRQGVEIHYDRVTKPQAE